MSTPLDHCVLDHVAIAVKDLEQSLKIYRDLGLVVSKEREILPSQGVKTAFIQVDQNAHIELLEPLDEKSTVHQFIQKRGEGIHHLCFRVKDLAKKCEELKAAGYRLIYDHPQEGAKKTLVNFIHPKSANGVLIELNQEEL